MGTPTCCVPELAVLHQSLIFFYLRTSEEPLRKTRKDVAWQIGVQAPSKDHTCVMSVAAKSRELAIRTALGERSALTQANPENRSRSD